MVTEKMIEAAHEVLSKEARPWIYRDSVKKALEAALSTDAEPVAEIVEANTPAAELLFGRDVKFFRPIHKLPIGTKLYSAPPAPSVAAKALENAAKMTVKDAAYHLKKYRPHCLEALEAALSAQVQDVAALSAWQGWDKSNLPWSEAKHKDAVCYAAFGEAWSMNDAATLLGFIDRTWPKAPAAKQEGKP